MKINDKIRKEVLKEFLPMLFSGNYSDVTIVESIKVCKEIMAGDSTKGHKELLINEAILESRYPNMNIEDIILLIKLAT
jgi:hypothetical protein